MKIALVRLFGAGAASIITSRLAGAGLAVCLGAAIPPGSKASAGKPTPTVGIERAIWLAQAAKKTKQVRDVAGPGTVLIPPNRPSASASGGVPQVEGSLPLDAESAPARQSAPAAGPRRPAGAQADGDG